jgi:hypothetical protein
LKNIAAIIVALALIPAISSASQVTDAINAKATAATSAQMAGGHIYVVNGDVFVAQGKNPAHRVTNNEAIISDTLVNTGKNSAALLKFEDGQVVTMQSNSTFQVREYRYDAKNTDNSNIVFSMFKGGMRFATGLIAKLKKQAFRLSTPNATIGIRGTEFMVTMADKSMYSQVLAGNITMTNAAGMKVVDAGQFAVVASSAALASLVSPLAIPAGTFSELLAIPVDPSAIPAPAPPTAPASVPAATTGEAGVTAEVGAAAAGASTGVAGGAMAGMAGSNSESIQAAPETAAPAASPEVSPEPAKQPAEKEMAASNSSGVGVTGKVGTLGYGVELVVGISDSFSARLGYSDVMTYKHNATESSVNYDFKLQPRTISVLGDWYPFEGSFRTSGGLMYNDNQVDLNGLPTGGNYIVNGNTYTSTQIGSLQGTVSFANVAPYLGIGWGNPVRKDKGWGMVSDIGVLYQGSPKVNLTATCATSCGSLQTDVAAESNQLESDLSHYKWWPVISIGISYQW